MEKPYFDRNRPAKKDFCNKINISFTSLKKITAILLLSLLLFNIAGYRWLFNYLEQKATARLENKIDAGSYSDEQLVEVKIPLNMPYYSDKEYESVYGETEWNGQHYRYVKRKISGNTLYLLCIPHNEKNSIANAENNFTKSVNDVSGNNSNQNKQTPSFVKLLLSEFLANETNVESVNVSSISIRLPGVNTKLNSLYNPLTPAQPPESVVAS
jgi:hypothetical protein